MKDTKEINALKELNSEVKERIKMYEDISQNNDVKVRSFDILTHPEFNDNYFVHISYLMHQNGEWLDMDEIELWTKDRGWFAISRDMNKLQVREFLKGCSSANFDVSNINIKA